MPKFKKKEHELKTIIDKWTYFIKKADKLEVIPENVTDKGLLAAYEEAQKHNWSKEEYDAYIYAGMREQDEKGRETAAEKRGAKQKTITVIKKCLKKNMSVTDIADITDLTMQEIEILIEQINTEKK